MAMDRFNKKTIEDLDVFGKKVLLRCDFNVPLKNGVIVDDVRICAALKTIESLIKKGAKLIICSHLGKPKNGPDSSLSLKPIAGRLSEKLGREVIFAADDDVVGKNAKEAVNGMQNGDVVVLQNTRFREEETKNSENFSRELASLADFFISDAFGSVHRAHCSTVGVSKFVKDSAVGYLIEKELKYLGEAVENPKRPFVNILGGAKISDKLLVIDNLLNKADILIIGGGMAYTFLKAKGLDVGTSLVDDGKLEFCREMLKKSEEKGVELLLPIDSVMIENFPNPIDSDVETSVYGVEEMRKDWMGVDVGPKTVEIFKNAINKASTVVWNGPMGVFENKKLSNGTFSVARALAECSAITIVGGGDSAAAINALGLLNKMSHVSTGGGASLEFLEGKELPGIACISQKV